jgi:hypothetical protein
VKGLDCFLAVLHVVVIVTTTGASLSELLTICHIVPIRQLSEDTAVATQRGKWSQVGVPHKGWRCIDVEDLGSPNQVCQMCESREIRFVHRMEHDDYPEIL